VKGETIDPTAREWKGDFLRAVLIQVAVVIAVLVVIWLVRG